MLPTCDLAYEMPALTNSWRNAVQGTCGTWMVVSFAAAAGVQAEGVELESAGGAVQLVRTSAPTGNGLLELEEALLLQVRLLTMLCMCAQRNRVVNMIQ